MKLEGNVKIDAPPEKLWHLLLDPEVVGAILPGCQEIKKVGPDEFEGLIDAKIGPVSNKYKAKFAISDKRELKSYRLKIQGIGKGGFVNGEALVELHPDGAGTELHYAGDGAVGGAVARVGQRLIEAAAKLLIDRGFEALKREVERRLQTQAN